MKTIIALIICTMSLCGISIAVGYSLAENKNSQVADIAGQFSDIIRLHKDGGCPSLQSDIDCILDNDSILANYVYCY